MNRAGPAAEERQQAGDKELKEDVEAHLWRAWTTAGATDAREQIFSRYASFARSIARRMQRSHSHGDLDMGDLQQLAYAGLIESIDRFDPDRGVPFRAYAARRISGSVLDGLPRMSEMREQMAWRRRVRRERIQSLKSRNPESLDHADALEALAEIAVGLALGFMLEDTGLIAPAPDAHADLQAPVSGAYESAVWKDMIRRLSDELTRLPERERAIIRRHYAEGLGFDHLAALLGISKARVSQLHRGALGALRKRMAAHGHFRLER